MSNFLLDTNAMIAKMNGDSLIEKIIVEAENIYLPIIAIGEAFFGAEKSAKADENSKKVEDLASSLTILECDVETARIFGKIMKNLRAKGRPIPQNDVWIAAIAMQHDLVLLTKDKHFDNVDDLKTQDW